MIKSLYTHTLNTAVFTLVATISLGTLQTVATHYKDSSIVSAVQRTSPLQRKLLDSQALATQQITEMAGKAVKMVLKK